MSIWSPKPSSIMGSFETAQWWDFSIQ